MRRGTTAAIVGASSAAVLIAAYFVADVQDAAPGIFTLSQAPAPSAAPTASAVPAPTLNVPQGQGDSQAPTSRELEEAWAPAVAAAQQGGWNAWAMVVDARSGNTLYEYNANSAHTPASITKILTAYTALSHLDPNSHLTTSVAQDSDNIYLEGEGDLLLGEGTNSIEVSGRAGLETLAKDTASSLTSKGISHVELHAAPALFADSARPASWSEQQVAGYEGQLAPYAIDAGRTYPKSTEFYADSISNVSEVFAQKLRAQGIDVDFGVRGAAPQGATRIASVQSASVDEQIRWMLYHSDNTLADQYCHFAARQSGGEASFAGSVQTLEKTLNDRGIPTDQLSLEDCSGLSSNDRIHPKTLATILSQGFDATQPAAPRLVRNLPWAGVQGTLANRLTDDIVAGNAQAKTGSLAEVSSLAGVVSTSKGHPVIFVIGFDKVPDDGAYATRGYLDHFVTAIAEM